MNHRLVAGGLLIVASIIGACGSDPADPAETSVGSEATNESGAAADELVTRYWIKPDLVDCVGEAEQKCMQVAEAPDGEYLYFYDQIAGFDFVEGTSYVIDVRIEQIANPPADGGSVAYTLVEVIEPSES